MEAGSGREDRWTRVKLAADRARVEGIAQVACTRREYLSSMTKDSKCKPDRSSTNRARPDVMQMMIGQMAFAVARVYRCRWSRAVKGRQPDAMKLLLFQLLRPSLAHDTGGSSRPLVPDQDRSSPLGLTWTSTYKFPLVFRPTATVFLRHVRLHSLLRLSLLQKR